MLAFTLSQELDHIAYDVELGENIKFESLKTKQQIKELLDLKIGIDIRSKSKNGKGSKSVFEGLDFDDKNLRSQAFVINYNNTTIGIMTFLIMPTSYIQRLRFFALNSYGVEIQDFKKIAGQEDFPNFLLVPGRTKVIPKYVGKFSNEITEFFRSVISLLSDKSPNNTWIEMVALGKFPLERKLEIKQFRNIESGTFLESQSIPFDINDIAKNVPGSNATIKVAKLLGLNKISDVGAFPSLGPVFIKKIS